MFEVDEQGWGELGKALIQSFEQLDDEDEPFGEPNAEYCWSGEPDHNGGWFCHHPECVVSPHADEGELQALERLDMYLDGDREMGDNLDS